MHPRHWFILFIMLCALNLPAAAQHMQRSTAAQQQYRSFLPLAVSAKTDAIPTTLPGTATPTPTQPTPVPTAKAFFALTDWLTYNAATAIDAQGRVHFAFYSSDERHQEDPRHQPAYYITCSAGIQACANPANWVDLVLIDTEVNEVQIALTSDGNPRLLIRRNGSRGYDYDYWACDQQCGAAQSWSGVWVTEAAGVEAEGTRHPQHSFALDSQNRPRFLYGNGWGNSRWPGVYYAYCDATDCSLTESWQQTVLESLQNVTVSADYGSLVFDGIKPRAITRVTHSGLADRVAYYACDEACADTASWTSTTIAHPEGKMWANWDLALDIHGNPRLALYEPAGIDIRVGGKLFYGWCDSACSAQNAAFQLVQVASGEGQNVDLGIDPQGRSHMVYDAGQRGTLGKLWCEASCNNPNSWQRRILETSEQIMHDFAPASPLTCDQQDQVWLDAIPNLAFDAKGQMVVAYDIVNYARCYSIDPTNPGTPVYSRVERIWWAVRWFTE